MRSRGDISTRQGRHGIDRALLDIIVPVLVARFQPQPCPLAVELAAATAAETAALAAWERT